MLNYTNNCTDNCTDKGYLASFKQFSKLCCARPDLSVRNRIGYGYPTYASETRIDEPEVTLYCCQSKLYAIVSLPHFLAHTFKIDNEATVALNTVGCENYIAAFIQAGCSTTSYLSYSDVTLLNQNIEVITIRSESEPNIAIVLCTHNGVNIESGYSPYVVVRLKHDTPDYVARVEIIPTNVKFNGKKYDSTNIPSNISEYFSTISLHSGVNVRGFSHDTYYFPDIQAIAKIRAKIKC